MQPIVQFHFKDSPGVLDELLLAIRRKGVKLKMDIEIEDDRRGYNLFIQYTCTIFAHSDEVPEALLIYHNEVSETTL